MRPLLVTVVAMVLADGCATRAPDLSEATGSIEYVEQEVAPLGPARVARVLVKEGDTVRVSDTLVVMTQPGLQEQIAGRRAQVAEAESELRDLEAGPRPAEIARAEADVQAATADANAAEREASRLSGLAGHGDVSQLQLDAAQTTAAVAAAHRDAAQQALRTTREGTRPDRIAAARADAASARAALDASMKTAADLVLTAPASGVVISRHVEPGEVFGAGGSMMTIGDVTHPFVRVYVDQLLLPMVRAGDTVTATLDAFPDRHFIGRIASVNTRAEFTPRVALTKDERADLLFGVRVEFTDASGMLKAGLPLTVRFIRTHGR